jgi:hypothetical protein
MSALPGCTVAQAREFVWGVDDAALSFVRKHISTLPDRVVITEKAREQSLKDARGGISPGGNKPTAPKPEQSCEATRSVTLSIVQE